MSPLPSATFTVLKTVSFAVMITALVLGAGIICAALFKGLREERKIQKIVATSSVTVK